MPAKLKKKAVLNFNVEAFKEIQAKSHTEQAIWFMNGLWQGEAENHAEDIWGFVHLFWELQYDKPKYYGAKGKKQREEKVAPEGSDLDQVKAQRFLEKLGEVKTATQLRKELATIDVDKNNKMSITEYLLFKYGKTPKDIIEAPQGGNMGKTSPFTLVGGAEPKSKEMPRISKEVIIMMLSPRTDGKVFFSETLAVSEEQSEEEESSSFDGNESESDSELSC